MILKFGKHETSILAGGGFAPNIKIKSNKENQLSLNINNIFLDESQFDDLLNSDIVDNIEFIYYNDIDNKNHTIIKIKFNSKYEKYRNVFIENEEGNGYLNLKIYLN